MHIRVSVTRRLGMEDRLEQAGGGPLSAAARAAAHGLRQRGSAGSMEREVGSAGQVAAADSSPATLRAHDAGAAGSSAAAHGAAATAAGGEQPALAGVALEAQNEHAQEGGSEEGGVDKAGGGVNSAGRGASAGDSSSSSVGAAAAAVAAGDEVPTAGQQPQDGSGVPLSEREIALRGCRTLECLREAHKRVGLTGSGCGKGPGAGTAHAQRTHACNRWKRDNRGHTQGLLLARGARGGHIHREAMQTCRPSGGGMMRVGTLDGWHAAPGRPRPGRSRAACDLSGQRLTALQSGLKWRMPQAHPAMPSIHAVGRRRLPARRSRSTRRSSTSRTS